MDYSNGNAVREHTSRDCIKKLAFIPTTNGGYDYNQSQQTDATGDCAVIAISIAASISYGEAHRRLKLLAKIPPKYQRILDIPQNANSRNPVDGTDITVCKLLLYTHFFNRQQEPHCICDETTPHVVIGITDDGTPHATAVTRGKTYGMYDITAKDFDVIEVWELDQQLTFKLGPFRENDFANQRKANALMKRLLGGDQVQ